jgi:hypothetical protein
MNASCISTKPETDINYLKRILNVLLTRRAHPPRYTLEKIPNKTEAFSRRLPTLSLSIIVYYYSVTPQVFGLHLYICMASHEHIHLIISCASTYVSMLQHDVSLVLMHRCIICGVPMLCLVH